MTPTRNLSPLPPAASRGPSGIALFLRPFLLLPFLIFALLGTGTMPARDAHGNFTVVLCTANGLVHAQISDDGQRRDAPDASGICPWAVHSQAFDTVPPVAAPILARVETAWRAPPPASRPAPERAVAGALARGPPVRG